MTNPSDSERVVIRADAADAIAYTIASLQGDDHGRAVIAGNCDPVGMVDAMSALVVALLVRGGLDPQAELANMLANMDAAPEGWSPS